MKFSPGNLVDGGLILSKGSVYQRAYRGKLIIQKWPKPRGPSQTPGDWYHRQEFGKIARWVSSPHPLDYFTAVETVKGTTLIPRDFLMMAAYGSAYELRNKDGTIWPTVRSMSANAQFVLDQVTDTPGSLMWRSPDGWVSLDPGDNGQVLSVIDQVPIWANTSGGESGQGSAAVACRDDGNTTATLASQGLYLYSQVPFRLERISARVVLVAGATYKFQVWTRVSGNAVTNLYTSEEFTAAASGLTTVIHPVTVLADIPSDIGVAFLMTRTDAATNTDCEVHQSTNVQTTIPLVGNVFKASAQAIDIATGTSIGASGSNTAFCLSLLGSFT